MLIMAQIPHGLNNSLIRPRSALSECLSQSNVFINNTVHYLQAVKVHYGTVMWVTGVSEVPEGIVLRLSNPSESLRHTDWHASPLSAALCLSDYISYHYSLNESLKWITLFLAPSVSHFSVLTFQTLCFSISLISSTAAPAVLIHKWYDEHLNKQQEFSLVDL